MPSTQQPGPENLSGQPNEALQQTQRLLAWSAYQESLRASDRIIIEQVQTAIGNLRTALWVKAGTYLLQLGIIGAAFFISSQYAIVSPVNNSASLIALVSLALFGLLLYRNPLQSVNRTFIDLARVQIILQGYQRQINQIDATFKQALLENQIDQEAQAKFLNQIQHIIDANVESLLQFIEEISG